MPPAGFGGGTITKDSAPFERRAKLLMGLFLALAMTFVAPRPAGASAGLTCPEFIGKPGAAVGVVCPSSGTASFAAAAGAAIPASRETIDRVVASVDNAAITHSEVETEYRIEVFLEEERLPVAPPDAATFERVRDHLIDQTLLVQEAASQQTEPGAFRDLAEQRLADIRKKCATDEAFHSDLRSLGIDERQLLERLEEQERVLRLIDQRMRPLVSVEHDEIEAYYRETFLPEYVRHYNGPAPVLGDVENQIREILVQKKIDQRLEAWLKELRSNHRVKLY